MNGRQLVGNRAINGWHCDVLYCTVALSKRLTIDLGRLERRQILTYTHANIFGALGMKWSLMMHDG
jgi:hypothetical protein